MHVHVVKELEEELLRQASIVKLGDALDPAQDVTSLLIDVGHESLLQIKVLVYLKEILC